MKVTKFNDELKHMNLQQLQEKLEQLRGQLFSVRLKTKTAHVKNNAEFKLLRGNIARVLTFMKNTEQQSATQ
jgi:ribosomal protein L29